MTKEELKKLFHRTRSILHAVQMTGIMHGVGSLPPMDEAQDNLMKLWNEFERYIDVLEPLKNVDRTRDTYTYVYAWLRSKERYSSGFNETAEMLSRATDIVFPKPTCPHCGKEIG